jgi:hypothetical protein
MSAGVGSVASIIVGVVLALIAIFGGVSAVSTSANPASASDALVTYDGS